MKWKYLFLFILIISCREKEEVSTPALPKFANCNNELSSCNDKIGGYCLFGFKWGEGNNFSAVGVDVEGPKMAGGKVTYSFQESPTTVSNHRQDDVPTVPFNNLPFCAKEKIRNAFIDWSSVANIEFEELSIDSESDIKIFVADISTRGNGFPNLTSTLCQQLAGHLILSPAYTSDCQIFYAYALHEIGHTLGLGHSDGENLMGSINTNLEGLKVGDIAGIRQIYGEK